MRKVVHLESCEYIVPIGHKTNQLSALSSKYQSTLQSVGSAKLRDKAEVRLFAKLNSKDLNGFQILAGVEIGGKPSASIPESLTVYRVADDSWNKTLIGSLTLTEHEPSVYSAFASNAFLGINELSGAETYLLEAKLRRRSRVFTKRQYFNHLGCFDNILQLRQQVEILTLTKLDI